MIDKIRTAWKYRFTKWVDTGETWREYELWSQTDHVAHVGVKICQRQVHEDTGETTVKRNHMIGVKEPLSEFDEDGILWPDNDSIPPMSEDDRVQK